MEFYILDSRFRTLDVLSTEDRRNPIFDDTFTQYLENGSSTFDFSVVLTRDLASSLSTMNYIMFFYNGKLHMHQIKSIEDSEGSSYVTRRVESESLSLMLYNNHLRITTIEGTVSRALSYTLDRTPWKVGYISPTLKDVTGLLKIDKVTPVYKVLQDLRVIYGNIEYDFRVVPVDSVYSNFDLFVDVYADGERGNKTYKRFEHDFNIDNIKRKEDTTEYYTALIGEGANGLSFANVRWATDLGDPCDKPLGSDVLIDEEAQKLLPTDQPIVGVYTSDTTSEEQLLVETYKALKECTSKKFTYDIPIKLASYEYDTLGVGDYAHIINDKFEPPIQLEARINTLELSFSDPTQNTATFSNYKHLKGKIRDVNSSSFVDDVKDAIFGHVGRLTQGDIFKIRMFLTQLNLSKEEVDRLLNEFKFKLPLEDGGIVDTSLDDEDFKSLNLGDKIDNGLWLGDNRLRSLIEHGCPGITTIETQTTETTSPSSANATEYKNAVKYYEKFDLGKYANNSNVSSLRSKSNKYKFYAIVPYWAAKFGLDPELVYALILAESSGNPYCKGAAYGAMQCEMSVYFNKKEKIVYYDGSTSTFTPSYKTMTPYKGGSTSLNGVKVDKNISNQIMFGCNELRKSLKYFKWNIFAALCGYNFGLYGTDWTICRYICDRDRLKFNDRYGYKAQSSKVQSLYFKELENLKCAWAATRYTFKEEKRLGTPWNIEGYLRWYKVVDGQLPYVLVAGEKRGYGANTAGLSNTTETNKTTKPGVATATRNKIVAKAREIVDLHVVHKKATYSQANRTYNDDNRHYASGYRNGLYKPALYDCSSLVSCAYNEAGLRSVYNKSCAAGTLIKSATSKSGYLFKKCTTEVLDNDAKPGDLIMVSNKRVTPNCKPSYYSASGKTHHVLVYCGKVEGKHMVAHARGNKPHPKAIMYMPVYSELFTNGILLRPWDLSEKDRDATVVVDGQGSADKVVEVIKVQEVTVKATINAKPEDFYDGDYLYTRLYKPDGSLDNVLPYPKIASHVLLDFSNPDTILSREGNIDSIKDLVRVVHRKYPSVLILIAKVPRINSQNTNNDNYNRYIDIHNDAILDFATHTPNVVQINVPKGIKSVNGNTISTNLTVDGWNLKDKTSADKYYQGYKKYILDISKLKGLPEEISLLSDVSTPDTRITPVGASVNIVMEDGLTYTYSNPLSSMTFSLPNVPSDMYYSKLIFKTGKDGEPTVVKQPNTVYLQGTDCINGKLLPKADTTYNISIYYNPDTEISTTRYLGNVIGVHKGGKYSDFDSFYDKQRVVSSTLSFYDEREKLVYGAISPMDFDDPQGNKSSWTVGGKLAINASALLNYVLKGFTYNKSPYANSNNNSNAKLGDCAWGIIGNPVEHEVAQLFVEQGWVFHEADLTNLSNIDEGDIIFMKSSQGNTTNFMGCNHTAIAVSTTQAVECTNSSTPINLVNLTDLKKHEILFIGRIRKD